MRVDTSKRTIEISSYYCNSVQQIIIIDLGAHTQRGFAVVRVCLCVCVCYSFSNFTSSHKRYDIINSSDVNGEPLNETPQQRDIYASPSHNL